MYTYMNMMYIYIYLMYIYIYTLRIYIYIYIYRGGPHMRSLISLDFPAPEMEPESAHVVSAVSVP